MSQIEEIKTGRWGKANEQEMQKPSRPSHLPAPSSCILRRSTPSPARCPTDRTGRRRTAAARSRRANRRRFSTHATIHSARLPRSDPAPAQPDPPTASHQATLAGRSASCCSLGEASPLLPGAPRVPCPSSAGRTPATYARAPRACACSPPQAMRLTCSCCPPKARPLSRVPAVHHRLGGSRAVHARRVCSARSATTERLA